jgi:Winged helix-turn helix
MVRLYYQGWDKVSLSRFFRISRPTVDRWIARFETEHFAGLIDRKRGPQSPRKVWFPVMVAVYHLQKRHPDAGEFRIWNLLARSDIAVRTVGRIMALNKRVYDDIPHVRKKRSQAIAPAASLQSPLSPRVLGAPHRQYGGVLYEITRITRRFCTHPPDPCPSGLESRKGGGSAAWGDKRRERAKLPSPSASA